LSRGGVSECGGKRGKGIRSSQKETFEGGGRAKGSQGFKNMGVRRTQSATWKPRKRKAQGDGPRAEKQ